VANLNKEEQGQRFSSHRWTTGLALDRARRLEELLLETEPEWRLFEALKAMGIFFQLNPGPVKLIDPDNPSGRVWFELDGCNIRYGGSSGYIIKRQRKTNTLKILIGCGSFLNRNVTMIQNAKLKVYCRHLKSLMLLIT